MTCVKTGADVYLAERCEILHGDLFQVGDTYILTLGGTKDQCTRYAATEEVVWHLATSRYTDCGSRAIAFEAQHASPFYYDGHTFSHD